MAVGEAKGERVKFICSQQSDFFSVSRFVLIRSSAEDRDRIKSPRNIIRKVAALARCVAMHRANERPISICVRPDSIHRQRSGEEKHLCSNISSELRASPDANINTQSNAITCSLKLAI